jgi:hypothetical protein
VRSSARLLSLLAALIASAPSLHAQVELGLFGGALAATSNFDIPATGFVSGFGPTTAKFTTALTYGALGRWWITERIGLQGTVGYANGNLLLQPPIPTVPDTSYPASTSAVTATLLYRLSASTIRNSVWLSAGAAWIDHSSPRLSDTQGTSSLGMTFGLGSLFPLNHHLGINLGFDAFIYTFDLQSPANDPAGTTQFEFRALAGLTVRTGN